MTRIGGKSSRDGKKVATGYCQQMKARKKVLVDHKRMGKTLVPPFVHRLGPLREVSWIKTVLPEILWIAFIQHLHGHRRGVELISAFSRLVRNIHNTSASNLFAALSSFSALSESEQRKLRLAMTEANIRVPIQEALNPLISWYPECPLGFISVERGARPSSEELLTIKKVLSSMYGRFDRDPVMVQATVVWLAFDAGLLKVNAGLSLARFPEIESYPDTEISRQIGGSIRSTVNMMFGSEIHYSDKFTWPGYFWNRGMIIDGCEFGNG
jgi:hypothetical protein